MPNEHNKFATDSMRSTTAGKEESEQLNEGLKRERERERERKEEEEERDLKVF